MEPRIVITRESEGGAIGSGLAVIQGTASNQAKLPGGANVRALGITGFAVDAAAKQQAVIIAGVAKAVADAAVSVGDYVMINAATGKLAPVGATAGTNYHVVGIALSAAAAQDDEFDVLVAPSRAQG